MYNIFIIVIFNLVFIHTTVYTFYLVFIYTTTVFTYTTKNNLKSTVTRIPF